MGIYEATILSALVLGAYSQCAAVTAGGVPVVPLDVCSATVAAGSSAGYQYTCDGSTLMYEIFDNADCSGSAITSSAATGVEANYDGDACAYASVTLEAGSADSCDSDTYTVVPYVVDECFSQSGVGADQTCVDNVVNVNTYNSSDCSGEPTFSVETYSSATDCMTVSCSGGGGGSSAAHKAGAVASMAAVAIASFFL